MKRIHPKVSLAAAMALAVLVAIAGCSNQPGGVTNPFLAPARVQPPATRVILPGQAQPYYPGDPLPVMHSNTAPPTNGDTLAASAPPEMPSADSRLSWTSPSGTPTPPIATTQPTSAPPQPQQLASANEPTVAIPTDGDALRFALPAPVEPEPLAPVAAAPMPDPAATNQPIQFAAAPINQGVVPASYAEPVMKAPISFDAPQPPVPSPWRSPPAQMMPLELPPPPVAQPMLAQSAAVPASSIPQLIAQNNMDVQLRAVASPPPRIRLPGYTTVPQTAINDGFRPRSSMR